MYNNYADCADDTSLLNELFSQLDEKYSSGDYMSVLDSFFEEARLPAFLWGQVEPYLE